MPRTDHLYRPRIQTPRVPELITHQPTRQFLTDLVQRIEKDEWVQYPPHLSLGLSVDQAIPHNTPTVVTWDQLQTPTAGFGQPLPTTDITIPVHGIYHVSGFCRWALSATGVRVFTIDDDLSTTLTGQSTPGHSTVKSILAAATTYPLDTDQTVSMEVFQDSGGPLDLLSGSHLTLTWHGPLFEP